MQQSIEGTFNARDSRQSLLRHHLYKGKIMKKILIIISIIVIVLVTACVVLLNKKTVTIEKEQVQIEQQKSVTPTKIKKKINVEKEPIMRDENDMPKSDVNVPEIG